MDCGALTNDRLLDHAERDPEPAARRHLLSCPACADRLADIQKIVSCLRELGDLGELNAGIRPDRERF
jgi:hypothetical protein